MAEITAALVKELRDRTGAGMMDCKKALAENNGDIEASIDWLRTKGLAAAAKKAGRVAAEGLVGFATEGTKGRYTFPYGDLSRLHRCAVISAESRAGQYHHESVENALKELLEMIDGADD